MQDKTNCFRATASLLALSNLILLPMGGHSEEFQPPKMQTEAPLAVGKDMPDVKAAGADGAAQPISDGKAKWTIVAFLSTRCPCTARYPTRLQEVEKQFVLRTRNVHEPSSVRSTHGAKRPIAKEFIPSCRSTKCLCAAV